MFETIDKSKNNDKYDVFIPKITDSIVYSMRKDNKDMAIPEQLKIIKDIFKNKK